MLKIRLEEGFTFKISHSKIETEKFTSSRVKPWFLTTDKLWGFLSDRLSASSKNIVSLLSPLLPCSLKRNILTLFLMDNYMWYAWHTFQFVLQNKAVPYQFLLNAFGNTSLIQSRCLPCFCLCFHLVVSSGTRDVESLWWSYVYGTVYHLYSCVKRNQLDATYFIIYSILIHYSTCFGR